MYYKVVYNYKEKLLPLVHCFIGVEYKVNEWTKPIEGTHLICVDNINDAIFWNKLYGGEIWECEVIKTKKTPVFLKKSNAFTDNVREFINKIIKLKRAKKKFTHLLQKGDYVFCDAIKLTKRVI